MATYDAQAVAIDVGDDLAIADNTVHVYDGQVALLGDAESYADGYAVGHADGYAVGYTDGYAVGYADGLAAAPAPVSPTVTVVSPAEDTQPGTPGGFPSDWAVARLTPVVIDIDGADLEYACIVAHYPVEGTEEIERVIYRRGSLRAGFSNNSSASQVTATKLRLSVLPDNGWPSSRSIAEISFSVDAIAGGAISDVGASS